MSLKVQFDCIAEPFLCSSFYCDKRMGFPIEYGVTLVFNYHNDKRLEEIVKILGQEKNRFSLSFDGEIILPMVDLSECVHIEHPSETRVMVKYVQNMFEDYQPGPFVPRKRVLKAENLLKMFQKYFSHLVKIDDNIEFELGKIKFKDKEKNNLIQYQQTDYEMLQQLLSWYNYNANTEDALTVTGSAADNRYQLAWLQEKKGRDLQYPEQRNLNNAIYSEFESIVRPGVKDALTPLVYKKQVTVQNICYTINRRRFDVDEWKKWKVIELPAYYNNHHAYFIRDTFLDTKDKILSWETSIYVLPKSVMQDVVPMQNKVWVGTGIVVNRTPTNFWIEVQLPGFESSADKADVRITSSYSGHSGNAGLHLVPEKNTEVEILKSADWLAPITLLHNIRSKEVVEKAPFWKLEDAAKWDFQSLHKEVKDMNITALDTITWKTKGVTTKMDSTKMEIS